MLLLLVFDHLLKKIMIMRLVLFEVLLSTLFELNIVPEIFN